MTENVHCQRCILFLDDNFHFWMIILEYDIKDVDYDKFESLEPDVTWSLHKTTVNTFQYQNLVIEDEESDQKQSL